MTTAEDLKVVLVGCGGMAHAWMSNIKSTPGIRVVGLVDVNRAAAEAMATKYELPAGVVFNTQEEAIRATRPDACFDVTVPSAHDQVVITALKHGCHVLGEKPMSDSMDKARAMVKAARDAGKLYAVTQNYRYNSEITSLASFLRGGGLGEVEELHADFYIGAHFGGFRDEMDYVLLLDMAIHTFDASRFISGADPKAVYCKAFNPRHSWYKGDASAVAIFEFEKDIVFSYRGSWCAEGLNTGWNSRWRIVGSKGSAMWDGATDLKAQTLKPDGKKGFVSEMEEKAIPVTPLAHGGHGGLMRDFLAAVRGGARPQTHCEDNIKSLAMVHAAVQSARTGQRVAVTW